VIRPVTPMDIEFVAELAMAAYPGRYKSRESAYDIVTKLAFGDLPFFMRTDNAFCLGDIVQDIYHEDVWRAYMVTMAWESGHSFQGMKLLRALVKWAHGRGASLTFGTDTGVDLAPFAKRLGAVLEPPSYRLDP
jgi:hypothetical protein